MSSNAIKCGVRAGDVDFEWILGGIAKPPGLAAKILVALGSFGVALGSFGAALSEFWRHRLFREVLSRFGAVLQTFWL